jgi:hypothetical protein
MPQQRSPSQLPPVKALQAIAKAIDEACDTHDLELTSKALGWCDELEPRLKSASQRVLLDYFRANAWANRMEVKRNEEGAVWSWDLDELRQQVFLLRRAAANTAFGELDVVRRCQIFTNLANQLDTAGRFIESRQLWTRALDLLPEFWMARANRARSLMHYAHALYDPGHRAVFALAAHRDLTQALGHLAAHPVLGDPLLQPFFASQAAAIEQHFDLAGIDASYRPDRFSLGRSKTERAYRSWCLKECLFLNPLNDLGPDPIAGQDVLTLPDFVTAIREPPVLIGFFNQLKQEFASARWLQYEGTRADRVHLSDRGVLLYNTLDYPALGLGVEQVKVAFRMSYSLLDKIAYFLNHYMKLGIPDKRVSFRHIWREKDQGPVRSQFLSSENWPLRGLYWLSKDLFEPEFQKVMEPEARALLDLRNHLEHKYVKVLSLWGGDPDNGTPGPLDDNLAHTVSVRDLESKALRLLQLARSALIYVSLGMHREESRRREVGGAEKLIMPMPLIALEDDHKCRW